jgi:hypothetical protein
MLFCLYRNSNNTTRYAQSLLRALTATRTRCYAHSMLGAHSLLRVVAATRTRCYTHSLLRALASTRTRFYPHSLLRTLAGTRTRCYAHSLLRALAATRTPRTRFYAHLLHAPWIYVPLILQQIQISVDQPCAGPGCQLLRYQRDI